MEPMWRRLMSHMWPGSHRLQTSGLFYIVCVWVCVCFPFSERHFGKNDQVTVWFLFIKEVTHGKVADQSVCTDGTTGLSVFSSATLSGWSDGGRCIPPPPAAVCCQSLCCSDFYIRSLAYWRLSGDRRGLVTAVVTSAERALSVLWRLTLASVLTEGGDETHWPWVKVHVKG